MSKEIKIILDELNFSIGRINEKEINNKQITDREYWYREGLNTAKKVVLKVEKLNQD